MKFQLPVFRVFNWWNTSFEVISTLVSKQAPNYDLQKKTQKALKTHLINAQPHIFPLMIQL